MVVYKKGCLLEALTNKDVTVIAHVCNCQRVMGSGIALQIKKKFPSVFKTYKESAMELGSIQFDSGVFNLLAQDKYGNDKRHLDYGALAVALNQMFMDVEIVAEKFPDETISVGVPFKMGCDRAGGDWKVVSEMLEFMSNFYQTPVVVYEL